MTNLYRASIWVLALIVGTASLAQEPERVEPPFWWAGMVNPDLQLLVYGEDIAGLQPQLDYPGVELRQVTRVENPNYLFMDLRLASDVRPGSFDISFKKGKRVVSTYTYSLNERREGSADRQGFDPSDVLYLITPDRFVNGNPANDEVEGMLEGENRSEVYGRHGGDIQGIVNSLDYISDMGFTAIWLNPVLENDMPSWSYHGYAATDFYKVDSRFGSNEEYLELSRLGHEKGIKMIMDMIANHCGSEHWWMKDFPMSDWVNYQADFQDSIYHITSHRKPVVQDPYASDIDREEFFDGWFVTTMPDLNQRNPFMATYLIQNSIWWVEYADLDGIRMDTYPYPDMYFMADWTEALMREYPNFNIVGEEWFEDPSIVGYWQVGKENPNGYVSYLPSLMDFPLQSAVSQSLNAENGQWAGWLKAYTMLANDFVYADPFNFVVFPDNHDMSRFFTQVNHDLDLFRLGLAYYTTIRGIPQIYYGTEVLMKNPGTTEHGVIRSDFPGGWEGDSINAFTGEGLSSDEIEIQQYIKTLLNWRKDNSVVHSGKLTHYNPKDDIYVLFRHSDAGKVMTILSKSEKEVELEVSRFKEVLGSSTAGREVITGRTVSLTEKIVVPARTPMIIDIQ